MMNESSVSIPVVHLFIHSFINQSNKQSQFQEIDLRSASFFSDFSPSSSPLILPFTGASEGAILPAL